MTHWASDLIGKQYRHGANGPDSFDCWGLVRYVLQTHYKINVPEFDVPDDWYTANKILTQTSELANWRKVDTMAEGQVVMMARREHPVHIGLAVAANGRLGVLHCAKPAGVLYQYLRGLQEAGWGRLTHYRHKTCS
jgi:cell wall-associated NlpC family hydrolase